MSEPAPDHAALIARWRNAVDAYAYGRSTVGSLMQAGSNLADALAALRGATPAGWQECDGFICPECGPTFVDEDGCCRGCGADTTPGRVLMALRPAPPEATE